MRRVSCSQQVAAVVVVVLAVVYTPDTLARASASAAGRVRQHPPHSNWLHCCLGWRQIMRSCCGLVMTQTLHELAWSESWGAYAHS